LQVIKRELSSTQSFPSAGFHRNALRTTELRKAPLLREAPLDSSLLAPDEGLPTSDRAMLDALGLGLYRVDTEGRCTSVNSAALRMLGYGAQEVLGGTCTS
jgi:PAS domain-containing protein